MTNVNQLQAEIDELQRQQEVLAAKIAPLEKERMQLYYRADKLRNLLAEARTAKGMWTTWDFVNVNPQGEGMAFIRARDEFAHSIGMKTGSYFPATMQYCYEFMFYRKQPLDEQIVRAVKAVETLARFMHAHEDDMLHFKVFEHTLSLHCSYSVHVKPDLSYAELHAGHHVETKGTLAEVLTYTAKRHWYE